MPDGTVRGTFDLSADPAIRTLHSIRDAGAEADVTLERLGSRMDSIGTRSTRMSTTVSTSFSMMRRHVTDDADLIIGKLDEVDRRLGKFGRTNAVARVSIDGIDAANAKLTELEARLDRIAHKRAIATVGTSRDPFANMAGGFGGGGASTAAGGGGGGMGLLGASPMLAAVPFAPGLLGGATALIGSAGSATAGLGALGLGAAGAIGVPGLAGRALASNAFSQASQLAALQMQATLARQTLGARSYQYRSAQRNFNLAAANAQPGAAAAGRRMAAFQYAWQDATAPGYRAFYGDVGQGVGRLNQNLPTIGRLSSSVMSSTGGAGVQLLRTMTDPQAMRQYSTMVASFRTELPIVAGSLGNLAHIFLNLSTAAIPFFHEADVWVNTWTGGMARTTSNTQRVQTTMGGLVRSTKDWMGLLGASGRLLKDIFTAGTPSGNSMVVQLTDSMNTWDRWIRDNPQKVQTFFRQAETSVSQIATVIGHLVKDIAQIFQWVDPIISRATQFIAFASGMGPGSLGLLGAIGYGAYGGARRVLPGLPSGGSLASAFITGSAGPGVAGEVAGGTAVGGAAAQRALRASNYEVATGRMGSGAFLMGGATEGPSAVLARRAAAAAATESGLFGGLLGGLATRSPMLARGADLLGTAGTLGRSALAGAARFALPVLAITSIMQGMQTRGNVGDKIVGGANSALHLASFGILPSDSLQQLVGAGSGEYAGLRLSADRGNLSRLAAQAGGVRTIAQMRQVNAQVARLRVGGWEMSPADQRKLDTYLTQISQTAATNAGVAASNSWATAFTSALNRGESPNRAVGTMVSGIQSELKQLGPKGARSFLSSTAQWVSQLEQENPKLRAPLERAMSTIMGDANKLYNRSLGKFTDLQKQLFFINGQIYTGTSNTWSAIRDDMTNKAQVAQEKLLGIFGTIQKESISALEQMGYPRQMATQILHTLAGGGAMAQVQTQMMNANATGNYSGFSKLGRAPSRLRHARGGVIPGKGLQDTVPVPGGLAAPGEAWIANRHTMNDISLATIARYGKTAWQMIGEETRLHSDPIGTAPPGARPQARNGIQPGFTTGGQLGFPASGRSLGGGSGIGNYTGMVTTANRIAMHHYPYLWGGGHNANFTGPYDCSGAVSAVLHGGGLLSAPMVAQQFMTYGMPGPGEVTLYASPSHVYMSMGGKFFGTSTQNPGGGADWFNGSALPGFVQRHVPVTGGGGRGALGAGAGLANALGGAALSLVAPGSGLFGVQGALANRGSAAYAAALSARLNATLGAGGGGISAAGWSGGGSIGANQALGRRMMLSAGWGPGQWPSLQALWTQESGWNANAVNSSSGAYGIPQALGHGHPYNLGDAPAQIAWGLNYIRGRYGSPAAAEQHERTFNWYGRGGRTKWAGWNAAGGQWVTNGPTIFGAGEGGRRERITISPHNAPTTQTTAGHHVEVNFRGPVHVGSRQDAEELGQQVAQKIIEALDRTAGGTTDKELATMGAGE